MGSMRRREKQVTRSSRNNLILGNRVHVKWMMKSEIRKRNRSWVMRNLIHTKIAVGKF